VGGNLSICHRKLVLWVAIVFKCVPVHLSSCSGGSLVQQCSVLYPACLLFFQEADIAAGPLYITERRRFAVDFTDPFMTVEASLLVRRPNGNGSPVQVASAEDLLSQPDVHFGTLNRGFIHHALRAANDSVISELWARMQAPDTYAFTHSNSEGIERVRRENFVFILPNKIAEYVSRRPPCDLMAVDNFLVKTGFGLALGKGSALTAKLNQALDLLARNGVLAMLYEKWWIVRGQCQGHDPQGLIAGSKAASNAGGRTTVFALLLLTAVFAGFRT